MGKYRKHSPETKVRIVLEVLRGEKSVAQASRDYLIKYSLLYRWQDEFLEGGKQAFTYGQATEQKRRARQSGRVGAPGGEADNAPGNCKKSLALCAISTARKRELALTLSQENPASMSVEQCSDWRAAAATATPSRVMRSACARRSWRWPGAMPPTAVGV